MLVEFYPARSLFREFGYTCLVLVTGQTRAIYAKHPIPQEEWFRGKL